MADDGIIEQQAAAALDQVHYPDSDGHFLPDNPLQARAVVRLRTDLEAHFRHVRNVVLEGDMFMYYEEGNPAASIAPDVYVVLEHDLGDRPVYKFWEEGRPPDFALEVVSPSSETRNHEDKRALYARLGIAEYFLFQPDVKRVGPRLWGFRLWGREYVELRAGAGGELISERLGVTLRPEGAYIRVRNRETGEDYAWRDEISDAHQAEKQRADSAERRIESAEQRIESAERRAESAERRAESQQQRAEAEAQARRGAEAENERLRALLDKFGLAAPE